MLVLVFRSRIVRDTAHGLFKFFLFNLTRSTILSNHFIYSLAYKKKILIVQMLMKMNKGLRNGQLTPLN